MKKERVCNIIFNGTAISSLLLSACHATDTQKVPVVDIPARSAQGGRTPQEATQDYEQCQEMAQRTHQEGICDPKDEVFGDVKAWEQQFPATQIMQYEYPGQKGEMPIQVTFLTAKKLCDELGGELPTSKTWESLFDTEWPWGDEPPDETRANIDLIGGNPNRPVLPSGSFPAGTTHEGVEDLTGNAWEWTINDQTDNPERKGGGAGTYIPFAKPAHVIGANSETVAGFRCIFPK